MSAWDSAIMAPVIVLAFFLPFGTGFLALCAFFDDRTESPLKSIQPFARIILLGGIALVVDIFLAFWFLAYDDDDGFVGAPFLLMAILGVMNWPFLAVGWLADAFLSGRDLDLPFVWSILLGLLFLFTGLFWGYVGDRLLCLIARLRSRAVTKSSQIT
jgi:hypothetical protein